MGKGCRAVLFLLLALLAGYPVTGAEARLGQLRLVGHTAVPSLSSPSMDVRWASDDSIYVLWYREGALEVGLDGARRRQVVPDAKTLGWFDHFDHLAVSPGDIAIASIYWQMAWRSRQPGEKGRVAFPRKDIAITHDLDIQGDRLLFLGVPVAGEPFAPDGAVAWAGTLRSGLNDLKPVLYDDGGSGAPHFKRCSSNEGKGAVRFLADGSFVIVPGFQKGVHLFDSGGQRIRSWTSEEVGLDTDCSKLLDEEEVQLRMRPEAWQRWLNTHHVVDDILPLPQGPGLLVRSMNKDGQVRWELKVLTPARVQSYAVPVLGRRPLDRLRGDVRNGKIVLLLSASGLGISANKADFVGEVYVAEMPDGQSAQRAERTGPHRPLQAAVASPTQGGIPLFEDKVGCSRIDNPNGSGAAPSYSGCGGSGGGCYDCLYAGVSGYSQCYESPDGSMSFCTDYQN